jgi:hypothetical protein
MGVCVLRDPARTSWDLYSPHPAESEFSINLLHNPCLRSLNIQFRRNPQNPYYLSHLLSEVVSCEMEEIVIGLWLAYDGPDVVDWSRVDVILAQPQYSKLRTLRICTNSHPSAWFIDHLPRSYARNILSIQPRKWDSTVL